MKKSEFLFILAVILAVLGLLEAFSGFVLWLIIPHGAKSSSQIFWALTRDTWVDIHDWTAVALLALVVIHIIFHWKWITRMFKTCCPYLRRNTG